MQFVRIICHQMARIEVKIKFSILLTVWTLLVSSCVIQIHGLSLTKDFNRLPDSCKEKFVVTRSPLDSLQYDEKVYLITTDALLSHLATEDSTLVYLWTPFCKSDACTSPKMFEEYCQDHGYRPYIMLDSYTEWQQYYDGRSRLLMFNPQQWDSNSCHKYIDNIYIALTGDAMKGCDYASYLLFHQGQLVKTMRYLE